MDPKLLHVVTGLPHGRGINVVALDDDSFQMHTSCKTMVFRDEELIPNEEGKFIINIEPLNLAFYYGDAPVPKEFEFPKEVYNARAEKRRLKALAKDAVFIDDSKNPFMYFYIEGDKLRILQGEKESIADKIEIVHGRKAVNVESLELGHPYLG